MSRFKLAPTSRGHFRGFPALRGSEDRGERCQMGGQAEQVNVRVKVR